MTHRRDSRSWVRRGCSDSLAHRRSSSCAGPDSTRSPTCRTPSLGPCTHNGATARRRCPRSPPTKPSGESPSLKCASRVRRWRSLTGLLRLGRRATSEPERRGGPDDHRRLARRRQHRAAALLARAADSGGLRRRDRTAGELAAAGPHLMTRSLGRAAELLLGRLAYDQLAYTIRATEESRMTW